MQKLLGFLPDADETTPGVITSCTNFIPYINGMKGAPSTATPSGVPAVAAAVAGCALVTKLDDTRRIFAGTTTKLYELVAGSWTDVSGAVYTGGVDTRWCFTQFGDSTLAANLTDTIQRSAGSGAFASIATAPKAKIVYTVGSFVMALNTVDGTYGTSPDRWWCSAANDDTSWTPSVTTLATTGRLVSSPGRITAGGRLGDYAVAYKEKAIFIGQFVGAPVVFDWQQVPGGEAGCVGQESWCDIGGAHFFVGLDNFWIFDGSRPIPIGVGEVRQWFFDNSAPGLRYKTKCLFDRQNNAVWIFYPSLSSTSCDEALVYHIGSKKWGRATVTVEAVLDYISAGVTIDGLSSVSATIDGLSSYSFDSQFWLSGGRSLSIFDTSHQLQSLTGPSASSSFTSGDIGDDDVTSLMTKARLRFAPGYTPTTATANAYTKMKEGDSLTVVSTGLPIYDGKFDVLQSARWHRMSFSFTGDVRVTEMGMTLYQQGLV